MVDVKIAKYDDLCGEDLLLHEVCRQLDVFNESVSFGITAMRPIEARIDA